MKKSIIFSIVCAAIVFIVALCVAVLFDVITRVAVPMF